MTAWFAPVSDDGELCNDVRTTTNDVRTTTNDLRTACIVISYGWYVIGLNLGHQPLIASATRRYMNGLRGSPCFNPRPMEISFVTPLFKSPDNLSRKIHSRSQPFSKSTLKIIHGFRFFFVWSIVSFNVKTTSSMLRPFKKAD
ncbi:hypothetical protein VNO77_43949 [Canavalia gladiata]|uniref:Uncharacterized protein n=1 Tax=Canavalia gladiata TaxID=3824 RepID=A0AAN9PNC8_CANGL